MEITIKINGKAVSVEVSYEVYKCLCESKRKTENLSHQQRRHWDTREFDEYIISTECTHIHIPTPEEILCHRETTSHEFAENIRQRPQLTGTGGKPMIDKTSIDNARNIDLITFLESYNGFHFRHLGGEYRCAAALHAAQGQPPNIGGFFHTQKQNNTIFLSRIAAEIEEKYMVFFTSAVDFLQTLVIALGVSLGIWGVINLLEEYGNYNPSANAHVR